MLCHIALLYILFSKQSVAEHQSPRDTPSFKYVDAVRVHNVEGRCAINMVIGTRRLAARPECLVISPVKEANEECSRTPAIRAAQRAARWKFVLLST